MATSLFLVVSLSGSCAPARSFDSQLGSIVKPYGFSIARWEFQTMRDGIKQLVLDKKREVSGELAEVVEYFSLVERIKALRPAIEAINCGDSQGDLISLEAELNELEGQREDLEEKVERMIEEQIRQTLAQQGIFNPVDNYIAPKASFPPLNFKLDRPPHLLVISPRDRIESIREVTLQQSIGLEEIEDIEVRIDELGVSSLVVGLGGFGGTYPTFVTNDASLRFTINTAAEEWLHQYMVFKPLGFLYLLDLTGLSRNYEIATMNETVAGIVSKEIGAIVYKNYYSGYDSADIQEPVADSEFDFNQEMRDIRRAIDEYLVRGEVEPAEEFMEQKRLYLASKGYYIRKLNQAYFAFYGTYADRPTSISPIGLELRELRSRSTSLKDFLDTTSAMTSRQALKIALSEN